MAMSDKSQARAVYDEIGDRFIWIFPDGHREPASTQESNQIRRTMATRDPERFGIESERGINLAQAMARSFSTNDEQFLGWLKRRGYEVTRKENGSYVVRQNKNEPARTIDPTPDGILSFLADLPADIMDFAPGDFVAGLPQAVLAYLAPASLPYQMAAGAGGGYAGELLRQSIGKGIGVTEKFDTGQAEAGAVAGALAPAASRGANALRRGAQQLGRMELELGQKVLAIPDQRGGIEGATDILARRADAAKPVFKVPFTDRRFGPKVGGLVPFDSQEEAALKIGEVIEGLRSNRLIPEKMELARVLKNDPRGVNLKRAFQDLTLGNFEDKVRRVEAGKFQKEIVEDLLEARGMPRSAAGRVIVNDPQAPITLDDLLTDVPAEDALQVNRKIQRQAYKRDESTNVRINNAFTAAARRAQHTLGETIKSQYGGPKSEVAKLFASISRKERLLSDLGQVFPVTPDPRPGINRLKATAKAVGGVNSILSEKKSGVLDAVKELDELFPGLELEKSARDAVAGSFFEGEGGKPTGRFRLGATGSLIGPAALGSVGAGAGFAREGDLKGTLGGAALGAGLGLGGAALFTDTAIIRNANLQRNLLNPALEAVMLPAERAAAQPESILQAVLQAIPRGRASGMGADQGPSFDDILELLRSTVASEEDSDLLGGQP